jgi:uncharacterized protein YkwD
MRYFVSFAVCLTLAGCGGSAPLAKQPEVLNDSFNDASTDVRDTTQAVESPSGDANFGNLLNNVRIDVGADAVRYDARLDAAAQGHADDMIAQSYFAHESLDGEDVRDRILAQGYTPTAWGENIAANQRTEQEALEGWQNSPSHNKMMTAESLEDFGLGHAADGSRTRWVLVMGTEAK